MATTRLKNLWKRLSFLRDKRGTSRQDGFTILIPVFDELEALEFSVFYFNKIGIEPLYALDSKRRRRKSEVEKIVGRPVPVFENDKGQIMETGMASLVALSPTDWILRVDCDEVPSLDALAYCREFLASARNRVIGFDRPQLLYSENHLLAVSTPAYVAEIASTQWRFFNRRYVKFLPEIHTSGIEVPHRKAVLAPQSAKLFHLEWLFTSEEQRRKKSANYDLLLQASRMRQWQLIDPEKLDYVLFENTHLRDTLQEWLTQTKRSLSNQPSIDL
jgi:hypothetical protein